jgi:hypothetical protein
MDFPERRGNATWNRRTLLESAHRGESSFTRLSRRADSLHQIFSLRACDETDACWPPVANRRACHPSVSQSSLEPFRVTFFGQECFRPM